MINSDHTPKT